MNEPVHTSQSEHDFQSKRGGAMIFGGIVYTGVVFAATTLFINFILTAFPDSAFGSQIIMTIAGALVGCSMLAFPFALHTWAVADKHRLVAIGLYFGEMLIIAVNTIVSFAALLYHNSGIPLPLWVAWYEPFSIGSIIYTLFAWGTIFLTDPQISRRAKERAAKEKFYDRVQARMEEFLETEQGEEAIERVAVSKIQQKFYPDLKKRQWGNGRLEENQVFARLPKPADNVRQPEQLPDLTPEQLEQLEKLLQQDRAGQASRSNGSRP